jgi:hypothetical protein
VTQMEPSAPDPSSSAPAGGELVISDQAVAYLGSAGAWARFLAVVGFAFAGLVSVGLLVLLTVVRPAEGTAQRSAMSAAAVLYGIWIVGAAVGASLLWGYGRKLGAFTVRGDAVALAGAFRNLRLLWMAGAVLYGLAVVIGAIIMLLMLAGVFPAPGTLPSPGR